MATNPAARRRAPAVRIYRHNCQLASTLDTSLDERGAQAFSLRLPEDLAKALREQAQAHERPRGAEVRHILRQALERDVSGPAGES